MTMAADRVPPKELTAQELDLLRGIKEGRGIYDIGLSLGMSEGEIFDCLKVISEKLCVDSYEEAIKVATEEGLLKKGSKDDLRPLHVGIVGCGRGGVAIIQMFNDDPSVSIVGVADQSMDAPGVLLAESLGVRVCRDIVELIVDEDLDILINVTGSEEVDALIAEHKPEGTELVHGLSARLMWQLVEEKMKVANERERASKERDSLYHLGVIIKNLDNLKDASQAIINYITRLTSAPAATLSIFNGETNEMELIAHKGFSADFGTDNWDIRPGGLTEQIFSLTETHFISDLMDTANPNDILIDEGVRSLLAAPLTIEGKTAGILLVCDFMKREFSEDEFGLFSVLTIYASLAIERAQSLEEIKVMSITDGLTGLYNHRYLSQQMEVEAMKASRRDHSFSIVMFDIDRFKSYNDTYGHMDGNKVLKKIGKIFADRTRLSDTIGRFGGEEFCAILTDTDLEGAKIYAERIRLDIEKTEFPNRAITISGGIAVFPTDGDDPHKLIVKADEHLYQSKEKGRNVISY